MVIVNDEALFIDRHPDVSNLAGIFDFGLAANDVIRLYDASGKIISSVVYRNSVAWPQMATMADYTLEYLQNGTFNDPNDPASWFDGCEGGSPGRAYEPCPVLPEGEDLYLYPNPTEDVINIVFGNSLNSSNGTEIQLFDAGGKLLVKKTAEAIESVVGVELDVSLFRHGVYFVRIIQSDKVLTKPFVKI